MTDKNADTRNTAFGAMQLGLQSIGAEKFELEDVDNEDMVSVVYLAPDTAVEFNSVPCKSGRRLNIETFRLDKQGTEKLVGSLDLMFDSPRTSWRDYPNIVALLKRLAELTPDANFAKKVRSHTE